LQIPKRKYPVFHLQSKNQYARRSVQYEMWIKDASHLDRTELGERLLKRLFHTTVVCWRRFFAICWRSKRCVCYDRWTDTKSFSLRNYHKVASCDERGPYCLIIQIWEYFILRGHDQVS
jgi:hypothetical protein